ncbi:MAG: sigma-70 family RNA polymerase sigma factor [Candidatus Rokubacteria bacterium]|nr:sigma-70 family RNA polymerase sigma factor [Candidatus Rokubacteria bacterium]MBI2555652.1 sigma-70 family RNA polymerase sigma factor [Candidatus Rokubacteria bacterium]
MQRELPPSRAVQPSDRAPDDPGLVEALRRGEPDAFERLVLAYQHRVFSIALRMLGDRGDAEEVAQEVFLRVHRSIRGFRGEAKLSTWLYAITSRLCLNRLKAPGRHRRAGEAALARIANGHPNPGAALEASEREAALHRAIAELDEERRIVVVLRDLHGLAYEEIAAALDLPLNTLRSRLHRARMELKERLERFWP